MGMVGKCVVCGKQTLDEEITICSSKCGEEYKEKTKQEKNIETT